jgi:methylated-DNA-[protein]-cysteine S-methyltransferase
MTGHLIFETALGFVALAWSNAGLTRLALPERTRAAAERHAEKWRAGPQVTDAGSQVADAGPQVADAADVPGFVAEAVALVRRYAKGETVDFSALPFDLAGADAFDRAVYAAALDLAQGQVTTYGELAERAGFAKLQARETGQALGRNPLPLLIPCHRILAAGGRIGGFSAPGGSATKERLLAHEGVRVGPPPPAQGSFAF